MKKYFNNFQTNTGSAISTGTVYVYLTGTSTKATLYEDDEVTTKANPLTTDANGEFSFKAADGNYDVVLSPGVGYESKTISKVQLGDFLELQDTTAVANGDALVGIKRTATGAVATTLHNWIEGQVLNVKTDFGAVGDGVTDDTAAFTAAVASGHPIMVPPTNASYYLATPIVAPAWMTIFGDPSGQGKGNAGYRPTLKPATAAFVGPDVSNQVEGFTCVGLAFSGGSVPLDLGLRHSIIIRDCAFISPTTAGISIVRGEKISIQNIDFIQNSADGGKCIAIGDTSSSTLSWGAWSDVWADRISIRDTWMRYGSFKFDHGIYCAGYINHLKVSNLVLHSLLSGCFYMASAGASIDLDTITVDSIGTSGAHVVKAFNFVGGLSDSTIRNLVIGGTSYYDTGIYLGKFADCVIEACAVPGDNSSQFGIYINENQTNAGALIGCGGAYYYNSADANKYRKVGLIGCKFTNNNTGSDGILGTWNNTDFDLSLIADANGSSACTSSFNVIVGTGSGNKRTVLSAAAGLVSVGDGVWNQTPMSMGVYREWVHASGIPRIAAGAPGSDVAGNAFVLANVSADKGNADSTLTVGSSQPTVIYNTAITADRAVTLSTTNAFAGAKFRVVRTANCTGAFNVNVGTGPLKAMSVAGSFCDVEYTGSAWILTAYGTL